LPPTCPTRRRSSGPEVLGVWYFVDVFAHELGHHYRNQYRARRNSTRGRKHEEFVADLHSARFYDAVVKRLKKGTALRASQ
jgi:hypothetical protein